jgi:hypothetical protein
MSIVDNERLESMAKKYKKCREVAKEKCPFSKNCGTCMYATYSQDSDMDEICARIKKEM